MICPNCGKDDDHVIKTVKQENVIFRWRKCKVCGAMLCTQETLWAKINLPSGSKKPKADSGGDRGVIFSGASAPSQ